MILSNDTGRVIQHTGAIFESPTSTSDETDTVETIRRAGTDDNSDLKESAAPASSQSKLPMVNATVRKYADAARRIVAATKEAVQGLDEKVGQLHFQRARSCLPTNSGRMLCASCVCALDNMK